jgi:hypothetical protein
MIASSRFQRLEVLDLARGAEFRPDSAQPRRLKVRYAPTFRAPRALDLLGLAITISLSLLGWGVYLLRLTARALLAAEPSLLARGWLCLSPPVPVGRIAPSLRRNCVSMPGTDIGDKCSEMRPVRLKARAMPRGRLSVSSLQVRSAFHNGLTY